jgi:hypothetical protein
MIDIVTVVFEPELDILQKQAQSLQLYVQNINSIIVVVNQDQDLYDQIDTAWWGSCQDRVKIISRKRFGREWSDNGWVSQQALKLLASTVGNSDWAVILDAKTIFVNHFHPLAPSPKVGQLDIYPVFKPSQAIANDLFGTKLQKQLGPGGVPFVINTSQAHAMIQWIEQHTQQDFAAWFQSQGMLTEFILYSAWIEFHTGSLSTIYNVAETDIIPINLCHSETAMFDQKIHQMKNATTVSIHRNAWSQLTADQQQQYTNFLASRGIH